MFVKKKILAAKKVVIASGLTLALSHTAFAGIPVLDALGLTQTTVSAIQGVAAVAKQLEQYRTQLQQYENMLQNTVAPAAYIWSEVDNVIGKVVQAQATLDYYRNQSGSIDSYLSRYQNVSYYQSSPCFQLSGCTPGDQRTLEERVAQNSEAVNRANADVIRSVDAQQQTLRSDANNLQRLQSQATSATGQMQALQAANQLAAAQANQLLQIRGMLLAQNQAATTLAQQQADRQAQQDAAAVTLRDGSNVSDSSSETWSLK